MSRTPSPALRRAVGAAKLGTAAALAALAVAPTLSASPVVVDRAQGPTAVDTTARDRLAALMERHDCSAEGLEPGVIPGSALVERDDRVRHVSFDDGWATFTGDAPGALLAVCRAVL